MPGLLIRNCPSLRWRRAGRKLISKGCIGNLRARPAAPDCAPDCQARAGWIPRRKAASTARRGGGPRPRWRQVDSLAFSDGRSWLPINTVFACARGWGNYSRKTVGNHIRATKTRRIFSLAPPPATVDSTENQTCRSGRSSRPFIYGIPEMAGEASKVADDTRAREFDPTSGKGQSVLRVSIIRDYIAFRFPALKDAPLLETRVCQYENSPGQQLIVDRHPARRCLAAGWRSGPTDSSTAGLGELMG